MRGINRATDRRPARSPRLLRNLPACLQIVRSRFNAALIYRQNVMLLLAVVLMQVFILRKVWTALYAGRYEIDGLTLHSMLVYVTVANLQNWTMQDPTVSTYMRDRVREGKVAFDLVRPVGFVTQILSHLLGSSLATTLFAVLALPVAALAGALSGPASPLALVGYLVSLLLGYIITVLLTMMLGLVAFWTVEISGLQLLYRLVNQFFAGALIPISFFPGALRFLAEVLPFQATTFAPVSIYVGLLSGRAAWQAISIQAMWVVLLSAAAWAMWRRALHRVVVQGG